MSEVPRLARGLPCAEVVSGARKLGFSAAGVGVQECLRDWGPWLGRDDAAEVLVAQIPDAPIREAGAWSTWSWKRRTREPGQERALTELGERRPGFWIRERVGESRPLRAEGGGPGRQGTAAAGPQQLSAAAAWLPARQAEAATINSSAKGEACADRTHPRGPIGRGAPSALSESPIARTMSRGGPEWDGARSGRRGGGASRNCL